MREIMRVMLIEFLFWEYENDSIYRISEIFNKLKHLLLSKEI
jgi:hypothetical protein